jgi:hypothetical protein
VKSNQNGANYFICIDVQVIMVGGLRKNQVNHKIRVPQVCQNVQSAQRALILLEKHLRSGVSFLKYMNVRQVIKAQVGFSRNSLRDILLRDPRFEKAGRFY